MAAIVGFDVALDKSPIRIQNMVDNALPASKYCTDGYLGYIDVVYPGKHVRNARDKSDAFTVEGVNADLRHYIPLLARVAGALPVSWKHYGRRWTYLLMHTTVLVSPNKNIARLV